MHSNLNHKNMTKLTELTYMRGVEKTLSVERLEVPDWAAKELNAQPTAIAQLEVGSSTFLYGVLAKYFFHRAVDYDKPPPSHSERIHKNPYNTNREYPGELTSIQNPPSEFADEWRVFLNDDDDGDDGDDSDHDENKDARKSSKITYMAGYGWGKIRTNPIIDDTLKAGDQIVVFHHHARGEPQKGTLGGRFGVHRIIVMYATSGAILRALCRDAHDWTTKRLKIVQSAITGKYMLFTLKISGCGTPEWVSHGQRPSRPISSVVLAPGIQEDLMSDARSFFKKKTKNWYYGHGIPYRRNYLFHGPPGTGKTSTIRALAGDQKLKACFMSLSHEGFHDHTLVEALTSIPKPCLIVFEDIDALFSDRQNKTPSKITFSGLLNAVDGMMSTEGTLMIMTTNHRDKLDPALSRCGRIDRQFEFSLPGHSEIARYYSSFYPDAPEEYATGFADAVFARKEKRARSLATLQQHFIFTRGESAKSSLDKVDEFFSTHHPDGAEDPLPYFG